MGAFHKNVPISAGDHVYSLAPGGKEARGPFVVAKVSYDGNQVEAVDPENVPGFVHTSCGRIMQINTCLKVKPL